MKLKIKTWNDGKIEAEVPEESIIYRNAPPAPPEYSGRSKTITVMGDIYETFKRYGVAWPGSVYCPHDKFTNGYQAIEKDLFCKFIDFLKPNMMNWWKWNSGEATWVCNDYAIDAFAFMRRWYPALAVAVTFGWFKYVSTIGRHAVVTFFDVDGGAWVYDPMWIGGGKTSAGSLMEFNDEKLGLVNNSNGIDHLFFY